MKNISKYRTAIMGVAALLIYYIHIVPIGLFTGTALEEVEWYFHRNAFCGVDIFLLLSSFGLVYYFKKNNVNGVKSYLQYLKKRIVRIYIVIIPITVLIAYIDQWSFIDFLKNITGINQLTVNVYTYLWFIACILIFYIFAPFYYKIFEKVHLKLVFTILMMSISIVLSVIFKDAIREDLYAIINRIPVFMLGFYFGEFSTREKNKIHPVAWVFLIAIFVVGIIYNYGLNKGTIAEIVPANNALSNVLIVPTASLLMAYFFQLAEKIFVGRGLVKLFEFWGVMSFEFYCVQEWMWGHFQTITGLDSNRMQWLCFIIVTSMACLLSKITLQMRNKIFPPKTVDVEEK